MTTAKKTTKPRPRRSRRERFDLDGQLTQLEKSDLVRRLSESELAYLFKHTLTQETAYESLLLKTRREIHLKVAQSYEKFYGDRLDEFAALLAQHYGEAQEDEKTLEYEIRAGDVAARQYANAEAVMHYSGAIELAQRDIGSGRPLLRELYLKRGRAHELSGKYLEAIANYQEMESAGSKVGDRALELAALLARGTLLSTPTPTYDPEAASKVLERALRLAGEIGDPEAESKALWNLMLLSKFMWQPETATSYGEQALAIARKHNLRERMAYTLNDLAVHAYMDTGDFQRGLKSLEEAQQLWKELDNRPMLADSLSNSALTLGLLGEFDKSLEFGHQARRVSEEIGNYWGQSYSRFVEGEIYAERGDIEPAIATMQVCIALGDTAGFIVPGVWIRSNLAWLYGWTGSFERGLELAGQARQSALAHLASWGPWPVAIAARIEIRRGRLHEAEQELRKAELDKQPEYLAKLLLQMAIPIAFARAELYLSLRNYAAADALLGPLLERVKSTGGRLYLHEVLYLNARVKLESGNEHEGREILLQAKEEAEAIGSKRVLWQILGLMSEIESREGNTDRSRVLRQQARVTIDYIAEHSPVHVRQCFLELPEVQSVLG